MTTYPSITGKNLVAALKKAGFEVIRIKGSHHFLRHADGRTTVIPVHSGETIGPGLLNKILRDRDFSREKLQQFFQGKRNQIQFPKTPPICPRKEKG